MYVVQIIVFLCVGLARKNFFEAIKTRKKIDKVEDFYFSIKSHKTGGMCRLYPKDISQRIKVKPVAAGSYGAIFIVKSYECDEGERPYGEDPIVIKLMFTREEWKDEIMDAYYNTKNFMKA